MQWKVACRWLDSSVTRISCHIDPRLVRQAGSSVPITHINADHSTSGVVRMQTLGLVNPGGLNEVRYFSPAGLWAQSTLVPVEKGLKGGTMGSATRVRALLRASLTDTDNTANHSML